MTISLFAFFERLMFGNAKLVAKFFEIACLLSMYLSKNFNTFPY